MSVSAGRRALAEALRHVGVRESPPGSNRTMFGRWFGVDGVPWCAIFVSYCFDVGAGVVLCRSWRGAGTGPRGVAYVPTLAAWLRATGRAVAPSRGLLGRGLLPLRVLIAPEQPKATGFFVEILGSGLLAHFPLLRDWAESP